jgi:hypothetical protein
VTPFTYTREGDHPSPTAITFPDDGCTESLIVIDLGGGLCRLEESPISSESAGWGDVIRCTPGPGGSLICTDVVQPSGLHREWFISSTAYQESQNWADLKERIMAAGGNWELVWGGIVILHYPQEKAEEFAPLLVAD